MGSSRELPARIRRHHVQNARGSLHGNQEIHSRQDNSLPENEAASALCEAACVDPFAHAGKKVEESLFTLALWRPDRK
jgi:hypothetical protein